VKILVYSHISSTYFPLTVRQVKKEFQNICCDWDQLIKRDKQGSISPTFYTKLLRSAFMSADPKSIKKTHNLTVYLALLGSVCVKAAHKMLVNLIPAQDWCTIIPEWITVAIWRAYYRPVCVLSTWSFSYQENGKKILPQFLKTRLKNSSLESILYNECILSLKT